MLVALLKDLLAVGEFSNSLIPLFRHHLSDFVTAAAHARARSGVGGGGGEGNFPDGEGDFPDGEGDFPDDEGDFPDDAVAQGA